MATCTLLDLYLKNGAQLITIDDIDPMLDEDTRAALIERILTVAAHIPVVMTSNSGAVISGAERVFEVEWNGDGGSRVEVV